jgi:hypothetical protein
LRLSFDLLLVGPSVRYGSNNYGRNHPTNRVLVGKNSAKANTKFRKKKIWRFRI